MFYIYALPEELPAPPPASSQVPYNTAALMAGILAASQTVQPYVFMGGRQPYEPRKLNPSITAVQVDNPPTTLYGPISLKMEVAETAYIMPSLWPYAFIGGAQPYSPKRVYPLHVDAPPFIYGGPTSEQIIAVAINYTMRDPWVYAYQGRGQPYDGPRKFTVGVAAPDNPPFIYGGPYADYAEILPSSQIVWPYLFHGRQQPYDGPRKLVSGTAVDNPPFTLGGPFALKLEIVSTSQPGWPYVFMGSAQPYAPRKFPQSTAAATVNDPPFGHRGRTITTQSIIRAWEARPFDFQMTLYASRKSIFASARRPSARGYIIV